MPETGQKAVRPCIILTREGRQLSEQGMRIVQYTVNNGYPLSDGESGEYLFACGLAYNDKNTLAKILKANPNTFVAVNAHEGVFTIPSGPDGPNMILDALADEGEPTSWSALRKLAREVYNA